MPRTSFSCRVHNLLFRDSHESLCSRAWRRQDHSRFWWLWTRLFGRRHCAESWDWYWRDVLHWLCFGGTAALRHIEHDYAAPVDKSALTYLTLDSRISESDQPGMTDMSKWNETSFTMGKKDDQTGIPVQGYTVQTDEKVEMVNQNKVLEEITMRQIDRHAENKAYDQRLVSMARSHLQIAYMLLNRAVFQPERINPSTPNLEAFEISVESLTQTLLRTQVK